MLSVNLNMPWIMFWSSEESKPKKYDEYDEPAYCWYDEIPRDEELLEEAREKVPEWLKLSERERYYFGFEIVETLPDNVRKSLMKKFKQRKKHAEKMLEILDVTDIMEG